MLVLFPSKKHKNSSVAMAMQRFFEFFRRKITAHYGTIYLISFTYVARLCASNLAKHIKKITSSFGVDYFLPLP